MDAAQAVLPVEHDDLKVIEGTAGTSSTLSYKDARHYSPVFLILIYFLLHHAAATVL